MASLMYSVAPIVNFSRPVNFSHRYVVTTDLVLSGKSKVVTPLSFTVRCEAVNPGKEVFLADGLIPTKITLPHALRRDYFPSDFKFGAWTSALTTEGSSTEGKRGMSIFDEYIDKMPDSYKNYKEDVKLLKDMGMNAYRFSIAWPRILPNGEGQVNKEGIEFYNKFIDALLAENIEPVITLLHSDLPQALQKKYKGFLDNQIVDDFKKYAEICFENFGDRVRFWITIDEPLSYGLSHKFTENFHQKLTSMHNVILAHATAAEVYHSKYQQKIPNGKIGISLGYRWYYEQPKGLTKENHKEFMLRWLMEPFVNGDYHSHVKQNGSPEFTYNEKEMLKKACDFIGVNFADELPFDDLTKLLIKIKKEYGHIKPEIFVCDKGCLDTPTITAAVSEKRRGELEPAFLDDNRIARVEKHLKSICEARKQGLNVKAYFMWTLMDNLELKSDGLANRYGLNFTDYYDEERKRYPKKSAKWFRNFLSDGHSNMD